ncbi:MAG: hypothetical protein AAF962_02490 [Actinomycetota bacterium]
MKHLTLQAGVRCHLLRTHLRDRWDAAVDDERGEVGSWMIVAAGLAAAAVAIVGILGPWLQDQANAITGNGAGE